MERRPFYSGAGQLGLVGRGGGWEAVRSVAASLDAWGWGGYTVRQLFKAGNLADRTRSQIRLRLRSGATRGLNISKMYVGVASGVGLNFAAPPIQVRFAGAAGIVVPVNTDIVSDPVTFAYSGTQDIIVSSFQPDPAADGAAMNNAVGTDEVWYRWGDYAALQLGELYTKHAAMNFILGADAK